MKQFFVIMFLFGLVFFVNAADLIILKNGEEIEAKVVEISSSEIRYQRWDNLKGPVIVIPISRVLVIKYENGTREVFNDTGKSTNNTDKETKAIDKKSQAMLLNLLVGFGSGSFIQGDSVGGAIGLIGDLIAFPCMAWGVSEDITPEGIKADTSVRTFGIIVFVGNRIFQVIRPNVYAKKFSVALLPVIENDGQLALAATVKLRF